MPTDTSVSKGQYFVPIDNTTEATRLDLTGRSKAFVVPTGTTFFATGSNAVVKAISFSSGANVTASLWNGGTILASDLAATTIHELTVYSVTTVSGRTILYY